MTSEDKARALEALRKIIGPESFDAMCEEHKNDLAQAMVNFVEDAPEDDRPQFALFDSDGSMKGGSDVPDFVLNALRNIVKTADGEPSTKSRRHQITETMTEAAHTQYKNARTVCRQIIDAWQVADYGDAAERTVAHTIFDDMMAACFIEQCVFGDMLNTRVGIPNGEPDESRAIKFGTPEMEALIERALQRALNGPILVAKQILRDRLEEMWNSPVLSNGPDGTPGEAS